MKRTLLGFLGAVLAIGAAPAQERKVVVSAAPALIETGLFRHILPRFKFKTQIAVELGEAPDVTFVEAETGAVFVWQGRTIGITPESPDGDAGRFADWLRSEVGQNTITSFGDGAFERAAFEAVVEEEVVLAGDAVAGERLTFLHCGRCHVVGEKNRMGGISSTPSFGAMKNFSDWKDRFVGFYALNPHPSFTQIEGLTEPFDITRPPPIVPVEITQKEYEAILAFLSRIPVKDLGGALISN